MCKAPRPYTTFDCGHVLNGVRLDGPVAFEDNGRQFVIARKHFIEVADRKRTALYELSDDFLSIKEHGEFPSTGDTAYPGAAPIGGGRRLITYYSTNIKQDEPWARAVFGPFPSSFFAQQAYAFRRDVS